MKKLFRTSKSTVDPLPPPPTPTPVPDARSPPQPPPPGKKGFQALMGGNNGHEVHDHKDHKGWGFNLGGEKVTPFPIDMGRDRDGSHPSAGMLKKKEKTKVPTLQEMQPDWRNTNGHYEPSSNHPYLPPGARPPSPPLALRPGTPTRYPYASTPSQSSQTSVHRDETPRPPAHTRDRGYSSASDSEPPVPLPKMNPIRSPLAYHPTPEEYSRSPPSHPHQQYHPEQWSGQDESYRHEEPKEKKKFWGVAWGGEKKDKHNKELGRPVMDDKRPSFEGYRENESVGHGSTGHHSHHSQSQNHSNQYSGPHVQMTQHETGIESAENVTQAIGTLFLGVMADNRYPGPRSRPTHVVDICSMRPSQSIPDSRFNL